MILKMLFKLENIYQSSVSAVHLRFLYISNHLLTIVLICSEIEKHAGQGRLYSYCWERYQAGLF